MSPPKEPPAPPEPAWVPVPTPAPSAAPGAGPDAPALSVKPSLRAAASTFLKVIALVGAALLMPFLVALLAGGGAAFLGAILLAEFGLFGILPVLVGLLLPAVRLAATRYDLDGEGVRVHSSIVARSDQRVPWDKVTLLVQTRTLADRLLGIERLSIVAYGARGTTLHLVGLHDARPLRDYAAKRMRDSASVAALFAND